MDHQAYNSYYTYDNSSEKQSEQPKSNQIFGQTPAGTKFQMALDALGSDYKLELPTKKKRNSPKLPSAPASMCCANCSTTETPVWRRDIMNRYVCNACGIYNRIHKINRPFNKFDDSEKSSKRKGKDKSSTDSSKSIKVYKSNESDTKDSYENVSVPSNRAFTSTNSNPAAARLLLTANEHSNLRYENLSNPELRSFSQLRNFEHVANSNHPRYSATKEYHTLAPLRIPRAGNPPERYNNQNFSAGSESAKMQNISAGSESAKMQNASAGSESGKMVHEFLGLSVLATEAASATTEPVQTMHPMSLKAFLM